MTFSQPSLHQEPPPGCRLSSLPRYVKSLHLPAVAAAAATESKPRYVGTPSMLRACGAQYTPKMLTSCEDSEQGKGQSMVCCCCRLLLLLLLLLFVDAKVARSLLLASCCWLTVAG